MRKTAGLLVVSLVVLGVVLVGFAAGRGCDCHQAKRGERVIALLDGSSLPEARRAELKEKLQAALPGAEGRKAKRRLREESAAILEAEHFDAEAYRESVNRMLAERRRQKGEILEVMVEIASELDREERKALADIFRRPHGLRRPPRAD